MNFYFYFIFLVSFFSKIGKHGLPVPSYSTWDPRKHTGQLFFPFIYLKAFVYLFIDCFYYYLFIVYYYYCLFIVYHWQARRARPLIRRSHMVTGPVPGVPCLRSPSTMPRSPRCPRDRVGQQFLFLKFVLWPFWWTLIMRFLIQKRIETTLKICVSGGV